MKFIKSISEYQSKSDRIEGWRPLAKLGLKIPNPIKIVTHQGFLFYKKNGLSADLKKEVLQAFQEIKAKNPSRGVYAGRGYYVPGLTAPPGPRSSSIRSEKMILEEVAKLFEFAITSKFDKAKAEINVIMHPFINPVFPMSGGCITPSKDNADELVVEAIYGNDEGVQSFYHDTFLVNVAQMVISKKSIQSKPEYLQATDDFDYKTFKTPEEFQDLQCLDDLTILTMCRDFKNLIDQYGPHRVEFAKQEEGVYFRDCTPFEFPIEDHVQFTEVKATVSRVSSAQDLERLNKNGQLIYIDKEVIQSRNMDLLTSIALELKRKITILYPGTATTAHAVTILREKGHTVVYVGNESFETGDRVFVSKKGKQLVAEKMLDRNLTYTVNPQQTGQTQADLLGGKAARLIELSWQKFPVPSFFAISTEAFDYFIEKNQLEDEIEILSLEKNRDKILALAKSLRKKINEGNIPEDLTEAILKNFKNLKSQEVAVRSSANIEDGEKASFAGQFATFLKIDKNDLLAKIKKCWASTFSESALLYARAVNIPVFKMKMAVVIMTMVDAVKAGVLFTKDVLHNDTSKIIIEAAHGLGEKVVDGLVEPDRYVMDKKSLEIISSRGAGVLSQNELVDLVKMAIKIEKKYKKAQDIEWAIDQAGKILILQTRPITT